jgi:predicted phage-related endonuclease
MTGGVYDDGPLCHHATFFYYQEDTWMETLNREMICYKTDDEWLELRKQDITSTELASLFEKSPYMSCYELWHRKHNPKLAVPFEENQRMKVGRKMEPVIAEILAEKYGWTIEPFKVYMRIPELRLGSSFDYLITAPFRALLEIKSVDWLQFMDHWTKDGENVEAPLHIEFQNQGELLCSGEEQIITGAWIGGNKDEKFTRLPDYQVWDAIIENSKKFWDSIKAHQEPPVDFKRDAEFIKTLYPYAETGKVMKATPTIESLALKYKITHDALKALETDKDAIKAEMLTLVGDAEKVKGDTFSISAGLVGPAHVEYDRTGYRNFKISFKKEKANV